MSVLDQFDYELPEERIARNPCAQRVEAKLLVYDRASAQVTHQHIFDLAQKLRTGDLLVLNNVRVDPARILWRKATGSPGELLLLKCLEDQESTSLWEALVGGKRLRTDHPYELPGQMIMVIQSWQETGVAHIELSGHEAAVLDWREKHGLPPLPPYIRGARKKRGEAETEVRDRERYQTEFAQAPGAVAAPTAGLHFTQDLLRSLQAQGVEICHLHLSVGWGTFRPLTQEQWDEGKLHEEEVRLSAQSARRVLAAKQAERRVVAVGTTVVRALEWWARQGMSPEGLVGPCDLFLKPGWAPQMVDALVTNFHLPKSSLMALVGGFLGERGVEKLLELYRLAVREEYRFYSYGDAMFIE